MVINNVLDLIEKVFGGNYEDITIIDTGKRINYNAEEITVKRLKEYKVENIECVGCEDDRIYIKV